MASTAAAAPPPRRGTRSFSFHSDKSGKSSRQSTGRLKETPAEKEAQRLHSKADPTLAMNEAEPSAVQATERSLLAPLRSIQHKDVFGNPIAEPDKSNPTRSRWERPLDTIRSFEAAIDGPYPQRGYARPGSEADWHKRGSYYASRSTVPSRPPSIYSMNVPRYPQDSYSGHRTPSHLDPRPSPPARDSYHESSHHGAYYGGHGGYNGGNGAAYPNRQPGSRPQPNPQYGYNRGGPTDIYPPQHRDRSYETVTSAGGSGTSGDHGSYQTDPSSDNSSLERASPPKHSPPANDYGIGFSGPSAYQPVAFSVSPNSNGASPSRIQKKPVPGTMGAMGATARPPAVPPKSHIGGQPTLAPVKQEPVKRKSWLFRRFSKNP